MKLQRDITTNLPYVKGVHLAFDHHFSEMIRNKVLIKNHILDANAPSASRVLYNHLGGEKIFPKEWKDMLIAVDKADSAQFSMDDIMNPQGWILLNFLLDPRTGIGRFKDYEILNHNFMMRLIDYCKNHTIDEIMRIQDVKERVDLYFEQSQFFKEQILRCSKVYGNLVVL